MTISTNTGITPLAVSQQTRQRVKSLGWVLFSDGEYRPADQVAVMAGVGVRPVTDPAEIARVESQWLARETAAQGGTYQQAAPVPVSVAQASSIAQRIPNPTPGQFDPQTGAIFDPASGWVGGTGSIRGTPSYGGSAPSKVISAPGGGGTTTPVSPATAPSPVNGLTNKEYDTYKALANNTIRELGVLDYEASDNEIASFFKSGFDAEGITNYYMTDPTFVERQPGLPYGLSRETYNETVGGYQKAWQSSFGGRTPMPQAPKAGSKQSDIDRNLVGYAIKQNVSPQQFGQTIERYRQTQGKAPTSAEDYSRFVQDRQTLAIAGESTGGVPGGVGAPRSTRQGSTRPAIRK